MKNLKHWLKIIIVWLVFIAIASIPFLIPEKRMLTGMVVSDDDGCVDGNIGNLTHILSRKNERFK